MKRTTGDAAGKLFSSRRHVLSYALTTLVTITALVPEAVHSMTENQRRLGDARERMKAFETERKPERLREAWLALENVAPAQESDPHARAAMRKERLYLSLQLLRVLDRFLDPQFDPKDVPALNLTPPPTPEGIQYPSGVDPAAIKDPKVRADYESALAINRTKAERYRLQIGLRRLSEQITPATEAFIRDSYRPVLGDQRELATAIDALIENPQRKADLAKVLSPSHPP